MRYLIYALLLATLIALIVKMALGEIDIPITHPDNKANNGLTVPSPSPPDDSEIWKELGNLFLSSLSFVLLPVMGGYYLFRLILTVHQFLFTLFALIVLVDISLLAIGVVHAEIDYERLYELLIIIKDYFYYKLGTLRSIALFIGSMYGILGYRADRKD